jgi:hypothetical protein
VAILVAFNGAVVDISQVDVSRFNTGEKLVEIGTNRPFVLTASSAVIDHSTVEAVRNQDTLRWLFESDPNTLIAGEGIVIDDSNPLAPVISAPGAEPFDSYQVRFVSPDGDNDNPGTIELPMKTASAAYESLPAAGGAIYCAIDTKWSDGTEGLGLADLQGCWLRQDGWTVAGWLAAKRVDFRGWGAGSETQFGENCVNLRWGDGNPANLLRTNPGIWIGTGLNQISFTGIKITARQSSRIGWDYRRNEDGTIAWANITGASRADGETVFTVSSPPGWVVTQMSRASNVVTARITAHGFVGGVTCAFHIETGSGAPTFADGDFTMSQATSVGSFQYDIQYADAGADQAVMAVTGASISGHMVKVHDLIDTTSTNAEFPPTFYRAIAVSPTTITVLDTSGYAPRSATATGSNVGTYVVHGRSFGSSFVRQTHCSMSIPPGFNPGDARWSYGPVVDIGASNGFGTTIVGGYYNGAGWNDGTAEHQGVRDPNRLASILVWSGSASACGLHLIGPVNLQSGHVEFQGGPDAVGFVFATHVIQDCDIGQHTRPCFESPGIGSATGLLLDCSNADAPAEAPDVDLGGLRGPILVMLCPKVIGAGDPAADLAMPIVLNERRSSWRDATTSFDADGKLGWWGNNGRLAGWRIDAQAQFGVFQGLGLENLLPAIGDWTEGSGVTVTPGQSSREINGTDEAFLVEGSGGSLASGAITTPAAALDDHFIFWTWIRGNNANGNKLPVTDLIFRGGYPTGNESLIQQYSPFGGDGQWDLLMRVGRCGASDVGETDFRMFFFTLTGYEYEVFGTTLIHLPAATYSRNAVWRLAHTIRAPFPQYLPLGLAGTMEGQKLIAHGGLGTGTAFVEGVGAGQLTVVGSFSPKKYEPVYEADGTIKGWVEMINATVNP